MDYSLFWHEENSEAYGSGYKAYAHELRTLAEQKGLVFHQTHAPLDCYIFGDESYNHRMLEQTLHAIEFSALLGAEQIIVHPIACPEGINPIEFNLAYYQQLLSTCERFKISVAIENTFARVGAEQKCVPSICSTATELCNLIDLLESEWIVGCLDVGHAILTNEKPDQMVRALGSRLKCLHIHDNDGIKDLHTLPYLGKIEWVPMIQSLVDVGYSGDLSLEIFGWLQKFNSYLLPQALEFAAHVGKELIRQKTQYEKYMKEGSKT